VILDIILLIIYKEIVIIFITFLKKIIVYGANTDNYEVINKSDQLKHKYPDDNIIYKCKCIQVDKINYNIKNY
jgi:hypothetical protein